jgi:hypothetical protein
VRIVQISSKHRARNTVSCLLKYACGEARISTRQFLYKLFAGEIIIKVQKETVVASQENGSQTLIYWISAKAWILLRKKE